MSSLRKKVSSYFRQLSFHNEPRQKRHFINENTFVNKYLTGQIGLKDAPPVLHGKSPNDLPNFEIGEYATGAQSIVGSATGPQGGLTTVKRIEKHLSIPDADIDYIDKPDDVGMYGAPPSHTPHPSGPSTLWNYTNISRLCLTNNKRGCVFGTFSAEQCVNNGAHNDQTPMKIKVAGQTYMVSSNVEKNQNQNRKSLSLGSLTDEKPVVVEQSTNTNVNIVTNTNNNNYDSEVTNKNVGRDALTLEQQHQEVEVEKAAQNYALSKSKSAGSSLDNKTHKKGKIIRLAQRPGQQGAYQISANAGGTATNVPEKWDHKSDFVYGISDSLYDSNQVSKEKNGNPIADCFGIIARGDSAILALADGVNWGEKASIAAKSAVHGSLHYINKTVFDDTSLFNFEIDSLNENAPINTNFEISAAPDPAHNQITNTNEIFICLLRAFNSAHNLILENGGMLTTLTVAVVLPLKQGNYKKGRAEKYICCACNLGDTFAYVYSPKCGIREITKGSHDITSNRDMRDALGALGPVDGINPELNNLTLSATTLEPGDIVLIASDGLTDNYDPSVCKFTVNQTVYDAPKHKATNINPQINHKTGSRPPVSKPTNRASLIQAQNQPHVTGNRLGASNISRLASTNINSAATKPVKTKTAENTNVKARDPRDPRDPKSAQDEIDFSNPLVAQFIQDNAIDAPPQNAPEASDKRAYRRTVSLVDPNKENNAKKTNLLSKSSSTSRVLKSKTNTNQQAPKMGFLRSKTSIDLNGPKETAQSAQIKRNEDGLPLVTPLQKYELTLLLMEDILVRGLSGREAPCVTARILCENLLRYTISITAAKRRTLEDKDLYYDLKNDIQVEISGREKKLRRKKCLEKIQNLPGKLDHVTVVAYNVGNRACAPLTSHV